MSPRTMFEFYRQYASIMLIALMGLFAVALALDEYNDHRRTMEDLRIESCVEIETEDYEWDETDISSQSVAPQTPTLTPKERNLSFDGRREKGYISDKQKIGLVRRYAPRKGIASHNYALI